MHTDGRSQAVAKRPSAAVRKRQLSANRVEKKRFFQTAHTLTAENAFFARRYRNTLLKV
jgi:hypothetical protein